LIGIPPPLEEKFLVKEFPQAQSTAAPRMRKTPAFWAGFLFFIFAFYGVLFMDSRTLLILLGLDMWEQEYKEWVMKFATTGLPIIAIVFSAIPITRRFGFGMLLGGVITWIIVGIGVVLLILGLMANRNTGNILL